MMKLSSLIVIACCVLLAGCNNGGAAASATAGTTGSATGKATPVKQGISTLKSLTIKDVKIGDGMIAGIKVDTKPVANEDLVSVEYTGTLGDGKVFDTNLPGKSTHDKPLIFTLGRGMVVPGLDQGVLGMKVGGEREIGIPPALGYGPVAQGPIPGNSDLHFHIKL